VRGERAFKPSRVDLVVLIFSARRKLLEIGSLESWIANCDEVQRASQCTFFVNSHQQKLQRFKGGN